MTQLDKLDQKTLAGLKELARLNVDSADGLRRAADDITDTDVKTLFQSLAAQRQGFAEKLTAEIRMEEADFEQRGSFSAKAHRLLLDLRSKVQPGELAAVLSEAERGEDRIKEKYEEVLKGTAGSPLNSVLQGQYTEIKQAHDRVRAMRDAAKKKN